MEQGGAQPLWISPAIFVEKKKVGCRRVVNFKALSKECQKEPNHTPDVLKLASQIPSIKDSKTEELFFSVLDAWNGYHSISLTEEASKYFVFSTEWGTYTYNVAPQGYLGSGDYYTKKMDQIMERIKTENPEIFKNPCSPEN